MRTLSFYGLSVGDGGSSPSRSRSIGTICSLSRDSVIKTPLSSFAGCGIIRDLLCSKFLLRILLYVIVIVRLKCKFDRSLFNDKCTEVQSYRYMTNVTQWEMGWTLCSRLAKSIGLPKPTGLPNARKSCTIPVCMRSCSVNPSGSCIV